MELYRVYHIDNTGRTLGHLNFESRDDSTARSDASIIQRTGKWPTIELWNGAREVECALVDNSMPL
jgi:hypothetical protein